MLLLVASGAYGQEKQKKSSIAKAARTKEIVAPSVALSVISGQVFIVTKGRANIKLALVEVSAISEKDLSQYLKAQHSNGIDQQRLLLPQRTASKNEVSIAAADVAQAKLVLQTSLWVGSTLSRMACKEDMRWTAWSCTGNCLG